MNVALLRWVLALPHPGWFDGLMVAASTAGIGGSVSLATGAALALAGEIFPPPLSWQLPGGKTVFALDIGAGVEFLMTDRTFARLDDGDRAVMYPALVLDKEGMPREDAFFGHDFRLQLGGGIRF